MIPDPTGPADVASPSSVRFGVRLAGVAVAMPAGTPMEYVVGASVFPLPLAPARVAGLMQLRGQPFVVLDASSRPAVVAGLSRHDVLVVGQPPQAAALLVEGPPQALAEASGPLAHGLPPDCAFASALGVGRIDERSGDAWYDIDPVRLIGALTRT